MPGGPLGHGRLALHAGQAERGRRSRPRRPRSSTSARRRLERPQDGAPRRVPAERRLSGGCRPTSRRGPTSPRFTRSPTTSSSGTRRPRRSTSSSLRGPAGAPASGSSRPCARALRAELRRLRKFSSRLFRPWTSSEGPVILCLTTEVAGGDGKDPPEGPDYRNPMPAEWTRLRGGTQADPPPVSSDAFLDRVWPPGG